MSKPLVSVIIPAWNAGPYIGETVESVLRQTHRPWELIVVDDGSTDDTVERLAPYQDSLRLIRSRHGGSAAARNAGLDAASGDYVAFLDADDLWHPTKLEVQLAVAGRHPESGLVVCEGIEFEGDRVLQERLIGGPLGERLRASAAGEITGWFYRDIVCQPLSAGASSIMIPRAVAERVGRQITTPGLAPDWDYTLRIARDYPITGHLDSLVRWRYRSSSQSGVRDRRLFRWTLLQVRTLRPHLRLCRDADRAFVAAILRRRACEGARQLYHYGRTHEVAYARTLLALLARSIPGNPIVLMYLLAAWLPSPLMDAAAWLRRSARRAAIGAPPKRGLFSPGVRPLQAHARPSVREGLETPGRPLGPQADMAAAASSPLVFVLVLNYCSLEDTLACVAAIRKIDYPGLRLLVIDNASPDRSGPELERHIAQSEFLQMPKNRGYAGGNNEGIKVALHADAEYILIVNPDVRLPPDTVTTCLDIFRKDQSIAAINSVQVGADGRTIDRSFLAGVLIPSGYTDKVFRPGTYPNLFEVRALFGAALMVKAEAFRKVGGFDPLYFAYGEDVDLSTRMLYHGFKLVATPRSPVVHLRTQHRSALSARVRFLKLKAHYLVRLKDPNRSFLSTFRGVASDLCRAMIDPARGLYPSNWHPITRRLIIRVGWWFLIHGYAVWRHRASEKLGRAHI